MIAVAWDPYLLKIAAEGYQCNITTTELDCDSDESVAVCAAAILCGLANHYTMAPSQWWR